LISLQSYRFLRVIQRFYLVQGMPLDRKRIGAFVDSRLMLMTALSPLIGYQRDAHIDEQADASGSTLRDAALDSAYVDAPTFDRVVDPCVMVGK
jgi:fumarate hydratase class II